MRRIGLYIGVAFLTLICGVFINSLVHKYLQSRIVIVDTKALRSESAMFPRFIAVSSLLEPDYHIYWYRTPTSNDPQEITLFADFRSAKVTYELFESNATPEGAKIVEIGWKLDQNGHKLGRRGVAIFNDAQAVRIFWTDGETFWSVQAPSLELAREFEESDVVHSITMSNTRLERTRR